MPHRPELLDPFRHSRPASLSAFLLGRHVASRPSLHEHLLDAIKIDRLPAIEVVDSREYPVMSTPTMPGSTALRTKPLIVILPCSRNG